MTTTPDEPAANSAPGPDAAPGRARRGRTVLIAVAVGMVLFGASAANSFASAGGFTADVVGQAIDCGGSERCIPGLKVDDVVDSLEAKGHTCERGLHFESAACTLEIGATVYETRVHPAEGDDQITEVEARVSRPDDGQPFGFPEDAPPPKGLVAYFSWMVSLPLGDDQTAVSDVTTWLNQQLDRGGGDAVQFGDYRYEVTVEGPGDMSLAVRAAEANKE